ncbi:RNA ligase 1 isoform X3 [Rattus norvegicus]|uniref:RNA ligase 1 isoform X3 n=1 Tax=Rattus norvegicus TaxID=10116 RepID=UPI0019172CD7|nr:uncharacterized protein C12orf29 homolog isoform X4 [Rattus norvegicus]
MLCSLTIALQLPECTATRRSLPVLSPRLSPGWTLTVLLGSSGWCLDSVCCCRLPPPGPQLSGDKLRVGTMNRLGSVQRKMPCVFVTEVKAEPSAKREHQPFKVLATETLSEKALDADVYNAVATEKVDGTCCYVTNYKGQPYLWARLDRKPNKQADKRFKKFLHSKENAKEFHWNTEEDFKPVPECWIPAKEIEKQNGKPVPDENGHIPGIT